MSSLGRLALMKRAQFYPDYSGLNVQNFLPISTRRQLTKEEERDVEAGWNRWWPIIWKSEADSPAAMMASPRRAGLLTGLLGAGLGAGVGHLLSKRFAGLSEQAHPELPVSKGMLYGGLGAGLVAGILKYYSQRAKNRTVVERLRRLPEGATIRDYRSDPVEQADEDRRVFRETYPY